MDFRRPQPAPFLVRRPGVGWLAALVAAAGCASYTSSVNADAPLHATSAYLYGRFFMNALPGTDSIAGGKQSMGLQIRCQDGSTYAFGSKDTREVQVLEIKPSRCWVTGVVFADQNGIVRKQLKADAATVQRQFEFTAGRAHYIGDYFAKGDYWVRVGSFATTENWEWAMSSPVGDRYEATTAEMKRAFPGLAALPTDDLRLIPEAERKRGNGIGPSPGEPPLTPQTVAGLAPFLGLSYWTPAQCEAACSAGQCLPYRRQVHPAMACVIRCDRDADCPTGFTCSCPNSDRPPGMECVPVTGMPRDPLARVCLSPAAVSQP